MADVGFYGDDVTGSVDVLLQFARNGVRGRLFIGLPDAEALARAAVESDLVGIAGIARSLPTAELDAEVRPALDALAALEPRIVQYKACSTADSSPDIGSLGRVLEIGREVFGAHPAPMLFAQPDFGRYTVFGHHFAAEGGVVHRLDRQPTMSTHPSTPMDESDLARHLARQTALPIGSLPFTAYSSPDAIADALASSPDAGVVLDALDHDHLALVGRALARLRRRPVFTVGSGGLSTALAVARDAGSTTLPRTTANRGPVLVVSGSRSPQTRRQADAAARAGWLVRPLALGEGLAQVTSEAIDALRAGTSVVLTSDDAVLSSGGAGLWPGELPEGTAAGGRPVLSGDDSGISLLSRIAVLSQIAQSAASVALSSVRAGATSRVVVCGGDTSGRVVRLLGVESVAIAAHPMGNVVALRAHADDDAVDGIELVLKGGQVGGDDLFLQLADPESPGRT